MTLSRPLVMNNVQVHVWTSQYQTYLSEIDDEVGRLEFVTPNKFLTPINLLPIVLP